MTRTLPFRLCLLLLFAVLHASGTCHAQQMVWATWAKAAPRLGPGEAEGLLVFFHQQYDNDVEKLPIPNLLLAVANVAKLDILRINRLPFVDTPAQDDRLLQFAGEQIARARDEGYKRIVVAGNQRGGWLALRAAALDTVDTSISLAPSRGEDLFPADGGLGPREELAQRLSAAKAKRIAAFFFAGDPVDDFEGQGGGTTRQTLKGTQAAFMVIDKPPGLHGVNASLQGRLTRRYRDCLLAFLQAAQAQPGENPCPTDSGYAVGADIEFPSSEARSLSDTGALAPYVGRWEGDDESGAYFILRSTGVTAAGITFLAGYSPPPQSRRRSSVRSLSFQLAPTGGQIFARLEPSPDVLRLTPASSTELELTRAEGTVTKTGKVRLFRR